VPDLPGGEISYMILPENQRHGFAREISQELVQYAVTVMGLKRFVITASPDNEISNKVALPLGFRCLDEQQYIHECWTNR